MTWGTRSMHTGAGIGRRICKFIIAAVPSLQQCAVTFCKSSCIEQLYLTQIIWLGHSPMLITSPELGKDSGFME